MVKINIADREQNWAGKVIVKHIELTNGTSEYPLTGVLTKDIASSAAYGIAFRRQSTESLGTPTLTKKVHTYPDGTFQTLCNLAAWVTGEIQFRDGADNEIKRIPIEYAGYDNLSHAPGDYLQLIMMEGFDLQTSKIMIDGTQVTTGEVLEIMLLPIMGTCKAKTVCS